MNPPALLVLLPGCMFTVVDADDWPRLQHIAWRATAHGGVNSYVTGYVEGRTTLMHRVIMGTPKGDPTDHLDGDGLHNTRANLRICTFSENRRNIHSGRRRLTNGLLPLGVSLCGIVQPRGAEPKVERYEALSNFHKQRHAALRAQRASVAS